MDGTRFTEKSTGLLTEAHKLAVDQGVAQIDVLHLASALFKDEDGYFANLITKNGGNAAAAQQAIEAKLRRLPTQNPPPTNVYRSHELDKLLAAAKAESRKMGDSYVALDHFVLALFEVRSVSQILGSAGCNKRGIRDVVVGMRSGRKVDSVHAEGSFDALNKFGIDFLALAKEGKKIGRAHV